MKPKICNFAVTHGPSMKFWIKTLTPARDLKINAFLHRICLQWKIDIFGQKSVIWEIFFSGLPYNIYLLNTISFFTTGANSVRNENRISYFFQVLESHGKFSCLDGQFYLLFGRPFGPFKFPAGTASKNLAWYITSNLIILIAGRTF